MFSYYVNGLSRDFLYTSILKVYDFKLFVQSINCKATASKTPI